MLSFTLSAPGKIILFGEHSVVYGKTAIAASIGLRTHLKYQEIKEDFILIQFEKIDLCHKINLKDLNDLIQHVNKICNDVTPQMIHHDIYLNSVTEFLQKDSKWQQFSHEQKSALTSLVYLFITIRSYKKYTSSRGFKIFINSDLKVGAGLGSSASFSVVLTGCFLLEIILNESKPLRITQFNMDQLCDISQWAYCSEKIMHGTPSGLDNCLCTYGSIVRYRRKEDPKVLQLSRGIQALLVDTKVPRQTKLMVSNVRTLVNNHTKVANYILDAMDELAREAETVITSEEEMETNKCQKLKDLIVINQGLLQTIGVSHETINTICKIAENKNLAAKLTGAGGGGYCIVILYNYEQAAILNLINDLERSGFPTIQTVLGGPGLIIE